LLARVRLVDRAAILSARSPPTSRLKWSQDISISTLLSAHRHGETGSAPASCEMIRSGKRRPTFRQLDFLMVNGGCTSAAPRAKSIIRSCQRWAELGLYGLCFGASCMLTSGAGQCHCAKAVAQAAAARQEQVAGANRNFCGFPAEAVARALVAVTA
jgi:hypothetical protein